MFATEDTEDSESMFHRGLTVGSAPQAKGAPSQL